MASNPIVYAPTSPAPANRVIPSPDEALQKALAGVDSSLFLDAKLGAPEKTDYRTDSLWFYATLAIPSTEDGAEIHSLWEADLVQGAVAEQLATTKDLSDAISGSSLTGQLPDGTSAGVIGGGAGDVATGQQFLLQDQSDDQIKASVTEIVDKLGLKPLEIDVLHPLGPAISLTVQAPSVDTATGMLKTLNDDILGDPENYEGLYIEIQLPDGAVVGSGSAASRSGSGRLYLNPKFDVDLGVAHG